MSLFRKLQSVRAVLTLWYSLILLLAFALFGAFAYLALDRTLHAALEDALTAEVDWISQQIVVGREELALSQGLRVLPPEVRDAIDAHLDLQAYHFTVVLTGLDGVELYSSGDPQMRAKLPRPGVRGKTVVAWVEPAPGDLVRVASLLQESFVLNVALRDDPVETSLRQTVNVLALLAPIALLVSVAGGWVIAGVVLRPIEEIAARADRITATSLGERIPPREIDDELGHLIRTLNTMIARLEASFEQMEQFSANVAHELKTPLTILRGEAELAMYGEMTSERAQQLAQGYLEETVRMSSMVDDMLTIARAEAGQLDISTERMDVSGLVDELYDDAVILASDKNIEVELSENASAVVLGDAKRLRRLFRSLLSNAVRYTEPGGVIRIESRLDSGTVQITVADTGVGIPPESVPRIFDRFFRVDHARSRKTGGAGLGLSLAKGIAEAHDGAITARSAPGVGSTFVVTLPLDKDARSAT